MGWLGGGEGEEKRMGVGGGRGSRRGGRGREGLGEGRGRLLLEYFRRHVAHNLGTFYVQQYVCPNKIRRDITRPSLPIFLSISSKRQCFHTLLCVGAVPPPSLTLWLVKTNSVYLVARYEKFTR